MAWFLLAAATLLAIFPTWAAYRGIFATIGLGVALVAVLGGIHRWLLAGLRDEMERRLAPEAVARRGLLDPEAVARLWAEHTSRQRDHRKPLFALLALDLWCDRIFGEGAAVPVAVGSEESIGPVELAV
jgi:hypothetical protein